MTSLAHTLVIDCTDPQALARFWGEVLDYGVVEEESDLVSIAPRAGAGVQLDLVHVLEKKSGKNRLHLDLHLADTDQAQEVARLEALGATRVDVGQGPDASWVVLADPEGNEFCVLDGGSED